MLENNFRWFILFLATACLTSVFSNMVTINFTIICMDPGKNSTINPANPLHHYSQGEKTMIQWTVSIASMIATFPFSYACTKIGAQYVFLATGLLSALSTAIIPPAIEWGFYWLLAARVMQGIAYACDFAVVGVICSRWASLRENAKFLALLTCFAPLSNALTNMVSGVICDSSLGWPWVHYSHALLGLFLFILWAIFYTDDPQNNKFVSKKELSIIHMDKSEAHRNHTGYVPYKEICKDKVVWAVWVNAFADLFSGFFLFIYAPTYTKKVLGFSTTETGIVGALGSLSHIPVKLVCGYFSDTCKCLPERKKMWIFNSVAVLTPAAIYIYLCFAPASMPLLTAIMFGGVHAALGFNCGGFYKCGSLVSRQYAEFVIAFTQFIKCSVFFIAPALVAIFVQDETNATQWHAIFYLTAGFLVVANIFFCIEATDKPASFTAITGPKTKQVE
ncbi:unnamed protein product [Bursaphelenchus xylophilus]|uniref:(pine wood nematode) hypothetical protein n=1 Tax=Bursaphelenchus xylophilus TaxID=6326 RepID=A0A1I7S1X1_BURXY|nr:unnamed protein product [Bursaphelenchus xylophilus]CAG9090059.1 unnamed protein product [Bursaphelenchus xylophilus]